MSEKLSNRKLVSIQVVSELKPIEGADIIEIAKVNGWECVVKKGEFKPGDKGIYFEVDSYLPLEERYAFLKEVRKNPYIGEGYLIKTKRLKGVLSQGLMLPLYVYPSELCLDNLDIGTDVTELLGIRKWMLPEIEGNAGTILGYKPFGIPTTDELRVQSTLELLESLSGKPYYIATKMDGTSCTIYNHEGQIGVCGRNDEYKNDGKSSMWKYVLNTGLYDRLIAYNKDYAIQGEYCGHGIQKNRLRLIEPKLYVFDIIDIRTRRPLDFKDFLKVCNDLELETVPIEEVGESFNYTLEELLLKAKGKYPSGFDKEGIVIRSQNYEYVLNVGNRLSFKVLNNDFLLKSKE